MLYHVAFIRKSMSFQETIGLIGSFFLSTMIQLSLVAQIEVAFPIVQPEDANFNRPLAGEDLDISPPGFCWWRAAPVGEVFYRLRIENSGGELVYESGLLQDPVHIPKIVLPADRYVWRVDALNHQDELLATREPQEFSIADGALALPWIAPSKLLESVPRQHPRLLFLRDNLPDIRTTLDLSRRAAYNDLRAVADQALQLDLMTKPDFDKYDKTTEYPLRRTAYRASYHEFTRVYNRGMVPLALMYLLSGEEKYGQAAKKHLLNLLDWELDGVASLEQNFDEIGLRIARTAAQAYDWLFEILTDDERDTVKQMLLARGDQMLERLIRRDFLFKSAYSHDGRLPGYLVEFSLVLAEEERAKIWMDFAMRALLTVFPHWGGKDGGWAEGINYVLSYNDRFITPLQSLYVATGYDLWKKSYFRKMRHFLMYCVAPLGEITPFGDSEHLSVTNRAGDVYSILQFHALRYEDPIVRWWMEFLDNDKENTQRLGVMHRILLPDELPPETPTMLAPDRAFFGVGWAALHSNIIDPERDLMCLFKSSPYGAVSHSHADQNSFAIMKGGKALANPSGARYPQHQSPFHFQYTNLTIAHNAILINGQGQIDRDAAAHGRLVDFQSTPHIGYVAGDAQKCYGDLIDYYVRHLILIRPSVILIVDDLAGPAPFEVDWLLHSREKIILNNERQEMVCQRHDEIMHTQLIAPKGFDFALTNEWPIDPKQDYPMVTAPPPASEWHFTASTRNKAQRHRIAAIMRVKEDGIYPECAIEVQNDVINLQGNFADDTWSGVINLNNAGDPKTPLLEIIYQPSAGAREEIVVAGDDRN